MCKVRRAIGCLYGCRFDCRPCPSLIIPRIDSDSTGGEPTLYESAIRAICGKSGQGSASITPALENDFPPTEKALYKTATRERSVLLQ